MKRRLRLAVAGVSAAVSLFGQAMALKFQPDHALSGPGGIFSVAVRLENPFARAVAAYQFFLGYDADLVAVESVVWPEGAILADGQYAAGAFDGRVSRLFPEWRDGQGTDVVSVSGFRGQGEDPGRSGLLCVIDFRVLAATRASTAFALDPGPYWSYSGVFDNSGASMPCAWDLTQVRLSAVPPVHNVRCARQDLNVTVVWDGPAGAVDAIDIYRDGARLSRLAASARDFSDRSAAPGAHTYGVATILDGVIGPMETCHVRLLIDGPRDLNCVYDGQAVKLSWTLAFTYGYIDLKRNDEFLARLDGNAAAYDDALVPQGQTALRYELRGVLAGVPSETAVCAVSLSTQEGRFLRGDVNMDRVRNLSDAVQLLRYLFSGAALRCLDAADFDDSGKIQIGDAVALLAWLFRGGAPPAPPADLPGLDPTPDGLSCAEGLDL